MSSDTERKALVPRDKQRNSSLAWVCSAGFLAGWRQLGVRKVLLEEGLEPDLIVGVSIGAYLGVLAAAQVCEEQVDSLFDEWNMKTAFPRNTKSNYGAFATHGGMGVIQRRFTGYKNLEDLPIKFVPVATDIETGDPTAFEVGDISDAIEASLAHPYFYPVKEIGGKFYYDGAVSNPAPVDIAKAFGADYVIFIDSFGSTAQSITPGIRNLSFLERFSLNHFPTHAGYHFFQSALRARELIGMVDRVIDNMGKNLAGRILDSCPPDLHIDINGTLEGNAKIKYNAQSFSDGKLYLKQGEKVALSYLEEIRKIKSKIYS